MFSTATRRSRLFCSDSSISFFSRASVKNCCQSMSAAGCVDDAPATAVAGSSSGKLAATGAAGRS